MKKKIGILISVLVVITVAIVAWLWIGPNLSKKEEKDTKDKQESKRIWLDDETVNKPVLLEGMQAITFEEGKEKPIILKEEDAKQGVWYDYIPQAQTTENGGTSKWANAMTSDGSMWVWIPRYAYKINWDKKEQTGKIDVVFLEGNTNYNKEGKDITTLGYTIHPAFKDGKTTGYSNGEWDKEITGIWVSKFEAGYAGQKNTASEDIEVRKTGLKYQRDAQNIFGKIEKDKTYMTYPVFIGKTYSYNNIEVGEIYDLLLNLNGEENPYGFDKTADTHLMKNSEWGAVAYLAHSQYGRNGSKVTINNMDVSQAIYSAGTVTGYAGDTVKASANTIEKLDKKLENSYNNKSYAWYTKEGKLASTTGNIYGIYDMNGGSSEYTAGYISGIDEERAMMYAKSIVENKESTKYCTVYSKGASTPSTLTENYEANKNIYGDAIVETSKRGNGYSSWFGETSNYVKESAGFFLRSGDYSRINYSGLFDFTNHSGHSFGSYSFHCALIAR